MPSAARHQHICDRGDEFRPSDRFFERTVGPHGQAGLATGIRNIRSQRHDWHLRIQAAAAAQAVNKFHGIAIRQMKIRQNDLESRQRRIGLSSMERARVMHRPACFFQGIDNNHRRGFVVLNQKHIAELEFAALRLGLVDPVGT